MFRIYKSHITVGDEMSLEMEYKGQAIIFCTLMGGESVIECANGLLRAYLKACKEIDEKWE